MSNCGFGLFLSLLSFGDPRENPQQPHYEVQMTLAELSFLQSSAVQGISRYGGDAGYRLLFYKSGEEVHAQLTVDTRRLLDVWTYWVNEQLADTLLAVDIASLDQASSFALQIGKSVRGKLDRAKEQPIYELVSVRGVLEFGDSSTYLRTESGRFELRGKTTLDSEGLLGRDVLIRGSIREQNVITAEAVRAYSPGKLELFVMSKCPYGNKAILGALEGLSARGGKDKSSLTLRYVFYRDAETGEFSSLHGELEIVEDLVQIVLQQMYPEELFFRYLYARSNSDSSWQDLVSDLGLRADDVETIEYRIKNERNLLMQGEFDYAIANYGIIDGSPTYVWEGELCDAGEVPFLKGRVSGIVAGACSR